MELPFGAHEPPKKKIALSLKTDAPSNPITNNIFTFYSIYSSQRSSLSLQLILEDHTNVQLVSLGPAKLFFHFVSFYLLLMVNFHLMNKIYNKLQHFWVPRMMMWSWKKAIPNPEIWFDQPHGSGKFIYFVVNVTSKLS